MDYESRKIKWYWLILFLAYCGWTVNTLFKGNPLLYSKSDLRSSLNSAPGNRLQTVPLHPVPGKLTTPTFQSRYNWARTAVDPLGSPRSKNYQEYEHQAVNFGGDEKFEIQSTAYDASGFYFTAKNRWVAAVSLDGSIRWKYHFKDSTSERGPFPVLLDESYAYLVNPQGEVVCLDKLNGEVHWLVELKNEVTSNPLLWKKNLLVPSKATTGQQLTAVDRLTGQVSSGNAHVELKPGFLLTYSSELEVMIATVDNKVVALDPEDWQVQWSQTVTDPIKGPAVTEDGQIYVATLGAKVVRLDGSRKGKVEWEADLTKPPANAPTYIPVINRLSIMDTSGWISIIEAKNGKVSQHFPTDNHGPLNETWSARLKGQFIEEFKMDWLQKGWTIWSPCFESSYCIFTPNKAMQVNRIALSGRPLTLPLPFGRHWVFLVQNKAGQYLLSHNLEDSEIKKLRKESAGDNPASGAATH